VSNEAQEKILLPAVNETTAITLKPKTAALCFDRVWAASDDVVPEPIRCWGGTDTELSGVGLAAGFNIQTNRTRIITMVGPEEKKLEMMKAGTDYGLATAFRKISASFAAKYKTPLIPVFDFIKQRNHMYGEGDRDVVVTALDNLNIVDEKLLTWEQVTEFRKDEDSQMKYRRFLHWLDKEMVGKSQIYIEDEIAIRLDNYESALAKHGIKTIVGAIEESLDGKMFLQAFAIADRLNLAGHPTLGFLVGTGIIAGKIIIRLIQVKLGYDDIERSQDGEISWVYEAKRQLN
jgi:hypothetical protein